MASRRRLVDRRLTGQKFLFEWRSRPWRARGGVCAIDGLKWWPVGGDRVRKPRGRFRVIGGIIGVKIRGLLVVKGRAVAHR